MSTEAIDFDGLYRRFADDVRSTLERYGGPHMSVEDGLNEVFRIALEELRLGIPQRAFLLNTAFNVANNWRRRVQFVYEVNGVPAEVVTGVPANEVGDDKSPEECLILKEETIGVRRVIDSLPEELRVVLFLAKIKEVPLAEIAVVLGLKESTVRSMFERAMVAFAEEARRRRKAGLLGVPVPVLIGQGADGQMATIDRWLRYALAAAVGGAAVAAWFLSRPPGQIPIHAEPPTLAEIRWTEAPAPPVTEPPPVTAPPPLTEPPAVLDMTQPDPDETARDELALYKRGLNAFNHGRYVRALELLKQHKTLYPNGTTAPLRDKLIGQIKALTAG